MATHTTALTHRLRRAALIAIAVGTLAGIAVSWSSLADRVSVAIFDAATDFLRWGTPRSAPELVVVGLDQATLDSTAEPLGLMHLQLADAIAGIAAGKPRLIVLDLVLPDRSVEAVRPGFDLALMRALAAARASAGLVLTIEPDANGRLQPIHPPLLAAAGADNVGVALYPLDGDHVVRRYLPVIGGEPTLIARAAQRLGLAAAPGWIDWSIGAPLAYQSMSEVVAAQRRGDGAALRATFEAKVVLLGSVLPFVGRLPQPVNLAGWKSGISSPPGVWAHAQALRNVLAGGFLQPVPWSVMGWLLAAFASLAGINGLVTRSLALMGAMSLSFAVAVALMPLGWMLPLGAVWIGGLVAVAVRTALDARLYRREQRRLAHTFGGYVSPQVLRAILDGRITAGGGRRHLAFLFADLRGFTALSERSSPEAILAWLNRYYAAITPVIHAHGGTIDNFRGDGLMVMFGAPEPIERPARAAIAAARAVGLALAQLNRELAAEGAPPLTLSLGVAAGDAVYGDLGSADRKDFTALGDAVNVAARLQDVAKELGYSIAVSRSALEESGWDAAGFVDLGEQVIKGHSPVHVMAWGPQT
ncbi:MAG: adenylate/guanylate cyclase domain-containing protein [Burkholderiaceae bacterium]